MKSRTSFVSTASSSGERFIHNMWNLSWNCSFTSMLAASCYSLLMNSTWLKLLFLVSLLWIFFAARKLFPTLHDASSGTIA